MLKILATGSSNMLGRGKGGPSPLTCDPHVKVWNNQNELVSAGTAFIPPPDFGNIPWNIGGANNPALWFACRCAQEIKEEVRLVVVSKGGRAIAEWAPGQPMYQGITDAYTASGLEPADVYLWMQGGGDERAETPKEVYKADFLQMISNLKADGFLAEDGIVIIGGYTEISPNVDSYLQELAAENGYGYASAEGLHIYDTLHYEGASLYHLGYFRFWKQYRDVIGFERMAGPAPLIAYI